MDTKDKVDLLLEEYRAMRSEIESRIGARFTLVGYVAALGTYAFFQVEADHLPKVSFDSWYIEGRTAVCLAGGLALLLLWILLGGLIRRCSHHVVELEQRINALAGEELLTWETRQVFTKKNLFHRIYDLILPWSRPSPLPPTAPPAPRRGRRR